MISMILCSAGKLHHPLSQAGGNWSFATNQYSAGNGTFGDPRPTRILGPEDPACTPSFLMPQYVGLAPSYSASSIIRSVTGILLTFPGSIIPGTDSPVWVATVVTDTNALNFVSFNAMFTSATGSHGLLSVYWDTNMIGLLDEAAVQPGFQSYVLPFPNSAPNTSHVLGFHLDPFTSVASTMILTNIVTGYVGVSTPFTLAVTTNMSNGLRILKLTGQPATYSVQAFGRPDQLGGYRHPGEYQWYG